ncbi:LuxR family transcriptional regulator, partial [Modestobacter roseus]|uniref:LuxR family transcriptional regulator n=1 Tax=Modestobacter roseus TaxID=1181884 RepID=UPI00132A3A16
AAVAAQLAARPETGTAAERAHHLRESNDLPGALTASLEAAAAARRVGAPAEQLQHLEAVLALWTAVPDAAERAGRPQEAVLLDTAAAARAVGDLHRAVALLRAAGELLGADGDRAARARVHYTLAQLLSRIEEAADAHRESSAALALVPAQPPSVVRTWAAATHARTSFALGRVPEATAAAEEALAAADALGLDSAWADTAVSLARGPAGVDPAVVRARLEEARARAERSGDADVETRVWFSLAITAHDSGEIEEALAYATAGLARARELNVEWSFYGAELRHLEVLTRHALGDWDGALAAADVLARVPDMAAHVRADGLLVLVGRGDPAARERLEWARGLAARWDTHVLLLIAITTAELELAARDGDPETAVERARTADRRLLELWGADRPVSLRLMATALAAVADAAEGARRAGDAASAARWVAEAEELATLGREAGEAAVAAYGPLGREGIAWTTRLAAELVRVHGRLAVESWRQAVADFGAFGHVYEQARSRLRLAEALLAGDDRAGAAAELAAAHEVAVRLGAEPLRTAVEALARRGRLDLPGVRAVEADAVFTPRETEVLALVAQGRTNRQIGAELFISEKTASVHVSNILAKLGAASRAEAVALAAARGLLSGG